MVRRLASARAARRALWTGFSARRARGRGAAGATERNEARLDSRAGRVLVGDFVELGTRRPWALSSGKPRAFTVAGRQRGEEESNAEGHARVPLAPHVVAMVEAAKSRSASVLPST